MDITPARVFGKSRSHKEKTYPPSPLKSKSSRTLMPEHRLPETPSRVGGGISPKRLPPMVLVNVTVQGSLGPVQVMASPEWSVKELVAATVQLYVKERRRPQLPTVETAAFGLHYSQFSLECLDAEEKLVDLASRNFFLCLKSISAAPAVVASQPECSKETVVASSLAPAMPVEWLRFIVFVM